MYVTLWTSKVCEDCLEKAVNCVYLDIDSSVVTTFDFLTKMKKLKFLKIKGTSNYRLSVYDIKTNLGKCVELLQLEISSLPQINESVYMHLSQSLSQTLKYLHVENASLVSSDCFQSILQNMKAIKAICLTPDEDIEGWASILNVYCGKICFGHEILDKIPQRLLHKRYAAYCRMPLV